MSELFGFSFNAMGGPCSLYLYADDSPQAESVAERVEQEVERIEARYSRYRPASILSQINRVADRGGAIEVDAETAGLLNYAYLCHARSGGLFDISSGLLREAWDFSRSELPSPAQLAQLMPRIGLDKIHWAPPRLAFGMAGMELDFGGIAKEYAADRAASVCIEAGAEHGLVELGGDIRIVGPHPDGAPWQIGIRHPRNPDTLFTTITLASGGLAGSGDYARGFVIEGQRYSHLLDPRSGWPVQGLAAVNVHADSCMVAGSLSTIAILMGQAGAEWLHGLGVAHLWIGDDGQHGGSLLNSTHR